MRPPRLLADPPAYTDEQRLHAALTHLRANAPVSWVEVPKYRPFWAITKHADIMDIERDNDAVHQLAPAGADHRRGRRAASRRRCAHADPHGRPAAPGGAGDRRRLVPPKAMRALKVRVDELAKIYVDQMWRGPRVRLRSAGRGQLPALRDHVAAGPAGGRLPADAQADPGAVRQRRRRVQARQPQRGAAAGAARLVPVLQWR